SGGLHGVGSSVVNALSTKLRLEIKNRGYLWEQDFSLGVPDYDLRQVRPLEDGERTGTTVTWFASPEIFETTDYTLETISTRFREMAFLNKGLRIELRDARPKAEDLADAVEDGTVDETAGVAVAASAVHAVDVDGHKALEQVFQYERGLADYVDFLHRSKTPISSIIAFEDQTSDDAANPMSLEIAMQWQASSYNESVHTFANTINTPE
ncbi:MAG: DNA topoisomerase IV subunit B, partial [Aeromicrobium sp.]